MGLCASNNAVDDQRDPAKVAPEKQPNRVEPKPANGEANAAQQPNSSRSSTTKHSVNGSPMDDEEYRTQIKSIFLFIFDRLVQTMEYERDSMHQLALLRDPSKSAGVSYLTLFGSDRVETWMRSVFDLSHVSMPPKGAGAGDSVLAEQNFRLLITGAQQVSEGGPKVSRADLTASVKEVCAATQSSLQATQQLLDQHRSSFPRYADLSTHFIFFQRCLNFTQGDIANDAAVLAKNVEDITNAA